MVGQGLAQRLELVEQSLQADPASQLEFAVTAIL
jgi:hypothetical protein